MWTQLRPTLLFLFSQSLFVCLLSGAGITERKQEMVQDLEFIRQSFEVGYAPLEWKKESLELDLDRAFREAKEQILMAPTLNLKAYQQILKRFAHRFHDYHVTVLFYSTEKSALPFRVRGVNGRYFIDWIDPIKLSPTFFSLSVGDELVEFDGQPIGHVMEQMLDECGHRGNPRTDQRSAELKLTLRSGIAGDMVPRGPVMITVQSVKSGKRESYQLHWSYIPEQIRPLPEHLQTVEWMDGWGEEGLLKTRKHELIERPKLKMSNRLHEMHALLAQEQKGALGGKESFLPELGEVIWRLGEEETKESESEEESKGDWQEENWPQLDPSSCPWHAYIYERPNGKTIGYVRIPHYHEMEPTMIEFGKILRWMQEQTDALVVDQLHNYGGYVNCVYGLASMFTTTPLRTPYHRIKITQKDVLTASLRLEEIRWVDQFLLGMKSEKRGEEKQDSKEGKSEVNYQELMFLKEHYTFILDEWNRGKTLTGLTHILGVDLINPHPQYRYTKPVVMLIDEMDFSGGDFMPAILQDNRRALLFGSKTAGAGGYVNSFSFPNKSGIASCECTGSIAERAGCNKIENIGVTPDIEYHLTVDDLENDYRGYVHVLNATVDALIERTEGASRDRPSNVTH